MYVCMCVEDVLVMMRGSTCVYMCICILENALVVLGVSMCVCV